MRSLWFTVNQKFFNSLISLWSGFLIPLERILIKVLESQRNLVLFEPLVQLDDTLVQGNNGHCWQWHLIFHHCAHNLRIEERVDRRVGSE